jgi:hypothetical protein
MAGPKHGVARGVAVYGVPHGPDLEHLDELLDRCERLHGSARAHGFALSSVAEDLELLDWAIDEWHRDGRIGHAALGNEVGLFLGTVIIAGIARARWPVRPNGTRVVHLASGRELDVVAIGDDRMNRGAPRLTKASGSRPGLGCQLKSRPAP